jgi:hypothetical protein
LKSKPEEAMNEAPYSHLDAALMRQIQYGQGSIIWLFNKAKHLAVLAEPCRTENAWLGRATAKQVIELRLHALQEAGLIAWDGSQWRVA